MTNDKPKYLLLVLFGVAVLIIAIMDFLRVNAAPSCPAGSTCGAIGIDSSFNVSVGTSTGPNGAARFVIAASSTAAPYSLKIFGPSGVQIFSVDNSGNVSTTGGINLEANGTNNAPLQVGYTAASPAGYYATYAP